MDEVSTGELARRLDRIELLLQGQVSRNEHAIAMAHNDQKLLDLERDIADKRRKHDEDVRELRAEVAELRDRLAKVHDSSGVNFRQAVYSGLIPAILLLVTLLVGFLQIKGGK